MAEDDSAPVSPDSRIFRKSSDARMGSLPFVILPPLATGEVFFMIRSHFWLVGGLVVRTQRLACASLRPQRRLA